MRQSKLLRHFMYGSLAVVFLSIIGVASFVNHYDALLARQVQERQLLHDTQVYLLELILRECTDHLGPIPDEWDVQFVSVSACTYTQAGQSMFVLRRQLPTGSDFVQVLPMGRFDDTIAMWKQRLRDSLAQRLRSSTQS